MKFPRGEYKTRNGDHAIVTKLAMRFNEWFILGAIENPETGVLHIASWDVQGRNVAASEFDLIEKIKEENDCDQSSSA